MNHINYEANERTNIFCNSFIYFYIISQHQRPDYETLSRSESILSEQIIIKKAQHSLNLTLHKMPFIILI